MPRAKKKEQSTEVKTTDETALVSWEEQMASQALVAAEMENSTAIGQFFSTKGGVLTWDGVALPDNETYAIILDSILENVYFPDAFDPDTPQSPLCFAYGRDGKTMEPHADIVAAGQAQCKTCADCKWNEWGSADVGKGKACKNNRRLGLLAAGDMGKDKAAFNLYDVVDYKSSQVGYLKVPVTSIKAYATFVKQVAAVIKRPPHGIVTKIYLKPDPNTVFKMNFDAVINVPNELLQVCMERHAEVAALIDFPYPLFNEDDSKTKAKTKTRGKRKY